MGKLNDKAVRAAKVESGEKFLSDGGGLYLRVRAADAPKVWFYRYTMNGTARKIRLGVFGDSANALALADARTKANDMTALRRQGIDPVLDAEAKEAARQAAIEAEARAAAVEAAKITVSTLFERWASVDLVRRKDGGAEVRRMFEKDILPTLGTMLVEDVRKGHITGITDALLARGVTRMAKLIFSLMRQMFRFAVDRGVIEFEPTSSIRKVKIGGKDTERDRVLSDDEIKVLARQLPKAGMSDTATAAVWIALSTCCRIGELMAARWEHVDLDRHTWWIPPENSKNKRAHTVHLSDFAHSRFQSLKAARDDAVTKGRQEDPEAKPSPWVYPNRRRTGALCPKTITKQLGDRQRPGMKPMKGRAKAELSDALVLVGGRWGPHDLRRTGATIMVKLGVLPEVAERCLNHVEENKVKRIYQRHSYENEMRQAWALLGDRLELLTNGVENVVPVAFGRVA